MREYEINECNCNDYAGVGRVEFSCDSKYYQGDEKDRRCRMTRCKFSEHLLLSDGKINTTAMSSLFGSAGDPKIVRNIGECEAIGNMVQI